LAAEETDFNIGWLRRWFLRPQDLRGSFLPAGVSSGTRTLTA
jgi:hypothetical protein